MRVGPYVVSPWLVTLVVLLLLAGGAGAYLLTRSGSSPTGAPVASASVTSSVTSSPGSPSAPVTTVTSSTSSSLPSSHPTSPRQPLIGTLVAGTARLRACVAGRCALAPAALMLVQVTGSGKQLLVETDRRGRFQLRLPTGHYRLQVIDGKHRVVASGQVVVSAASVKLSLLPSRPAPSR